MKTILLLILVLPFTVRADDENYYRTHWSYEVYKETESNLICDNALLQGTPYHNKAQPEPELLKLPMKSVKCHFLLATENESTKLVSRVFECVDDQKKVSKTTIKCGPSHKADSTVISLKGNKESGLKVRFFCSYL